MALSLTIDTTMSKILSKYQKWVLIGLLLIASLEVTWVTIHARGLKSYLRANFVDSSFVPQFSSSNIPSWHLFGLNVHDRDGIPLSNLPVSLQGVYIAPQAKESHGIFQVGGESNIYHVGERLTSRAKIVQILPESVIISNNGHLERLLLNEE